MKPKILIIAPHSKCQTVKRDCDLRAKEIAENMEKIAKDAGYEVMLFESDTLRINNDYNRKESFDTEWRQKIRDYIEKNKDYPIIIYEMHSFPNNDTEFNDSQMAFVAIDEYYDYAEEMLEYLKNIGIKASSDINNTRVVNLMIDTTQYDNIKRHYLIEINEDKKILNESDTRMALMEIFFTSLLPSYMLFCRKYFGYLVVIILLLILFFNFSYFANKLKNSRIFKKRHEMD